MNNMRIRGMTILSFSAGAVVIIVAIGITSWSVEYSSRDTFCMSCHEMRIVGEQGWMKSIHYNNEAGVVATCSDCHIPHSLFPKLYVKARDGSKDVFVHFFGESDPYTMDWNHLSGNARSKIYDGSCRHCHKNLTPIGASIKAIEAHREYLRNQEAAGCMDCHEEAFHDEFLTYLSGHDTRPHNGGHK